MVIFRHTSCCVVVGSPFSMFQFMLCAIRIGMLDSISHKHTRTDTHTLASPDIKCVNKQEEEFFVCPLVAVR